MPINKLSYYYCRYFRKTYSCYTRSRIEFSIVSILLSVPATTMQRNVVDYKARKYIVYFLVNGFRRFFVYFFLSFVYNSMHTRPRSCICTTLLYIRVVRQAAVISVLSTHKNELENAPKCVRNNNSKNNYNYYYNNRTVLICRINNGIIFVRVLLIVVRPSFVPRRSIPVGDHSTER